VIPTAARGSLGNHIAPGAPRAYATRTF
jgi:hypothetical protein